MIPIEAIARVAEVFDRFNNAFDPNSGEARQAEDQFNAAVCSLHAAHAADVDFHAFRYELVARCRKYLAKNR
jgi:hypothetical protein